MPRRRRSKLSSALTILILVAALALWIHDASRGTDPFWKSKSTDTTPPARETTSPPSESGEPETTGKYKTYRNCTLVKDRGNDGDSFKVKLPDGKTETLRLYYVDTPESAFKTYGGGRNNHGRIADQARDMGNITSRQAVEIGKKAKDFALNHLGKAPFTIHTEWDSPFNDQRYHAFVEISYNSKTRYLHELLVEKGYARIHTKGATMPDGTSERKHENYLHSLK